MLAKRRTGFHRLVQREGFPTLGMGTFAYLPILILLRKGWFTIR